MHLQPGDRLDNWEIVDILGEGGMGAVYRARSTLVDDVFAALKVTHPRNYEHARERFGREVKALLRLNHPAIVRVQGFGEDRARGLLWFAMDLVEGHPLDTWVEAGAAFPLSSALPMFAVLAEGLAHAHERGVAHRDLKPANVIVRADGAPVMVDFGISATEGEDRLTRTGAVIGTPQYLPPEALEGRLDDPMKGDLYAIGQMLFEVIVGGPAFPMDPNLTSTQNALRIMHQKVMRANLDPGEAFPAVVRALTRQLTAEEPADRVPSARAAVDRLVAAHEAVASGRAPAEQAPGTSWVRDERRSPGAGPPGGARGGDGPGVGAAVGSGEPGARAGGDPARSAPTWGERAGGAPQSVGRDARGPGRSAERDGLHGRAERTGERDAHGPARTGERDGYAHGPARTGERDGYAGGPTRTGERDGYAHGPARTGERDAHGPARTGERDAHGPARTGERDGYDGGPTRTGERDGYDGGAAGTGVTVTGRGARAGGVAMLFGAGLAATGAIAAIGAGVVVLVGVLLVVLFAGPSGGRGGRVASPDAAPGAIAVAADPSGGHDTGVASGEADPGRSRREARAEGASGGSRGAQMGSAASATADDDPPALAGAVGDPRASGTTRDDAARSGTADLAVRAGASSAVDGAPRDGDKVAAPALATGGTPSGSSPGSGSTAADSTGTAPSAGSSAARGTATSTGSSPAPTSATTTASPAATSAGTGADDGAGSATTGTEAVVRSAPPVVKWSTVAGVSKGSSDSAVSAILGPSAPASSPHCKSSESGIGYLDGGVIVCRTVFGGARRVVVFAQAAAAARQRSGDPKLAALGKLSSEVPSIVGQPQARPSSNRWTYEFQKVMLEFTNDRLATMVVEL